MPRFGAIGWTLLLAGIPLSAQPHNLPPTASFTATPNQGPPPLTVAVDGSGSSDADGTVTAWTWTWGDGSGAASGAAATHVYGATGTYFITLVVTDDLGSTASTTREITCISAGNLAPVAVIQSASTFAGRPSQPVIFTGAGHDDTGPLEHRWEFGDGSPPVIFPGGPNHAITTPSHAFADVGTYVVRLQVTDPENVSSTHQMSFLVAVPPPDDGGGGGGGCGVLGLEALLALGIRRWRLPCRAR